MLEITDHIVSMMQQLAFYDHLLSHDHPGYLGVLRLAMNKTKGQTDTWIIRLYLITLTVYAMQVILGLFSMNVNIPRNGVYASPHRNSDGTQAPFYVFGIICVGMFGAGVILWALVWYMFRQSERATGRKIKVW